MNGQQLLDFLKSLPKESLRKVVYVGNDKGGYTEMRAMSDGYATILLEGTD